MKQITEDYVSFEIAKLLKEKKFGWKCNTAYLEFEDDRVELRYEDKALYQEQLKRRYCVPALLAPSLYNAMKWLREVHRIETHIVLSELNADNSRKYMFDIYSSDTNRDFDSIQRYDFDSFEQAVEASLLYVLKNLI